MCKFRTEFSADITFGGKFRRKVSSETVHKIHFRYVPGFILMGIMVHTKASKHSLLKTSVTR
jgi:hypothetical protein